MMPTLRTAWYVAALAALTPLAAMDGALANHYILPCQAACDNPHWVLTGNLNTARSLHTATLLKDGKVLVVGGRGTGGAEVFASAEMYDPETGEWSLTGSLTIPRFGHAATLLANGQVLVVGGEYSFPTRLTGTAELYDPTRGTWSQTGRLNVPRIGSSATVLQTGEVLVAGGVDSAYNELASAELYDPVTGTWRVTGDLNVARDGHTATLLPDGKVLVARGMNGDVDNFNLSSAELYDPVSGQWNIVGPSVSSGIFHTATLLSDGTVLIAGGYGGGTAGYLALAVSEQFDPASQTWRRNGELLAQRFYHTATLLPGGAVLISGGAVEIGYFGNLQSVTLASAERFDPGAGNWSSASSLNMARMGHTATLLSDGRVLVAGGKVNGPDFTEIPLNSAELYMVEASLGGMIGPGTERAWSTLDNDNVATVMQLLPTGRRWIRNFGGQIERSQ